MTTLTLTHDQYFKDIKLKQFLGIEEICSLEENLRLDPVGPCRFQNEASKDL